MCYYLLPHISKNLKFDDVKIVFSDENTNNICKTSYAYLTTLKKEIEQHTDKWDNFKKITNTYEYIHSQIPNNKMSVSKHKPLSRSYFKFIEIANIFDLLDFNKKTNINTFHLYEGPGGFIEAILNMRNNENDNYHGMTLLNNDENTPGWKKSTKFLKANKNVIIEGGCDNTGNIISSNNYKHLINDKEYLNKFEIITGDGGFDFSKNFNNQENICNKLILAQILYAITMQKKQGSFVLKIFDIFSKATIDFLYLLSLFYDKVYIHKPHTSRLANSEKYIVCKNFKFTTSKNYLPLFYDLIYKMETTDKIFICNLLKIKIPYFFICKIEEISNVLCQFQINIINNTIQLIKYNKPDIKDKIDEMIRLNVSKCVQWCLKNNVTYNKNCKI